MKKSLKQTFPILQYLHHYPALRGSFWLVIGIVAATNFSFPDIPKLMLPVAVLLSLAFHKKSTIPFLFVGIIAYSYESAKYSDTINCLVNVTHDPVVISFQSSPRYTTDSGVVQSVKISRDGCSGIVDCQLQQPILPGEVASAIGTFHSFSSVEYPWKQSESQIGRVQGIHGTFSIDSIVSYQRQTNLVNSIAQRFDREVCNYSNPTKSLLKALFRADRSEISDSVQELFKRTGIAHLLAISGQHIVIIVGIIALLLKPIPLPRQVTLFLTIVLPWAVVLFTGTAPSIIRALTMSSILLALFFAGRIVKPFNVFGAAVVLLLIPSPGLLFTPGFQLSFGAVAAIIGAVSLVQRVTERKVIRNIALFFVVPISAGVATTPITAAFFGTTVPVGFVANLFLTPLFSIYFVAVLPIFTLGLCYAPARHVIESMTDTFLQLATKLAVWCNQPPTELVTVTPELIFFPFVIVLLLLAMRGKRTIVLVYALLGIVTISVLPRSLATIETGSDTFSFRRTERVDYLEISEPKLVTNDLIRWLKKDSKQRFLVIELPEKQAGMWLLKIRKNSGYSKVYSIQSNSVPTGDDVLDGTEKLAVNDTVELNEKVIYPY